MSRKTYYILIIIFILIFIVLVLAGDAYYTYLNAAKIEKSIEMAAPNITRAARVLCDPIENDTIAGIDIPEEAKQFCREVGREDI